jgi:hypothetical protein
MNSIGTLTWRTLRLVCKGLDSQQNQKLRSTDDGKEIYRRLLSIIF